MARDHARILISVWADEDFKARNYEEQWAYFVLTSQPDINNAGVLALRPRRWARLAPNVDRELIEKALSALAATNFVIVDEETEEVLVRSFIRNDGVAKQPNVLISACRQAAQVESKELRRVLATELRRVLADGVKGDAEREVRRTILELDPQGSADPSPTVTGTLSSTPLGEGFGRDPSPKATRSRGDGEGDGEGGSSPSIDDQLGGRAHAGTREATATPPDSPPGADEPPAIPPKSARPSELCPRHREDPTDGPCRACGRARQAAVEFDRQRLAAIRRCPMCDDDEFLLEVGRRMPVSPYTRCDHGTDQRVQVAAAKDEPA